MNAQEYPRNVKPASGPKLSNHTRRQNSAIPIRRGVIIGVDIVGGLRIMTSGGNILRRLFWIGFQTVPSCGKKLNGGVSTVDNKVLLTPFSATSPFE